MADGGVRVSDKELRLRVDQIAKMWGINPDSIFKVTVSSDTKTLTIEYQDER